MALRQAQRRLGDQWQVTSKHQWRKPVRAGLLKRRGTALRQPDVLRITQCLACAETLECHASRGLPQQSVSGFSEPGR